MKKAVILGAGLATRLYPITHHIPKVLVNYKQHTILKNLHDIYKDLGADEIIVVVHSKFKDMVQAYADQEGLTIRIECVDESYGSAYALARLNHVLEGHNVVLNWCDIIPDFNCFGWDRNEIMTYGNECRYQFIEGGKIRNVGGTGGNVVGIYQIRDWEFYMGVTYEDINKGCDGRDFVDFLYGNIFKQHELVNLIDLGDMPKLEKAHENRELNRSFNSVEINEDTVTKIALTEQGALLQKDELEWYSSLKGCESIPKIISKHPGGHFVMERIKGLPMFDHLHRLNGIERIEVIDKILDALQFKAASITVSKEQMEADFKKEFYDKVISRCESIQALIDSFGKITNVNGVKIGRLKPMLKQALAHLVKYQNSRKYHVIHGDPNFSNTMMSEDGEVKFIDPRGYFGNTKIHGPRLYDEAKVLYAISGYDDFNSDALWGGMEIDANVNGAFIDIQPLIYKYEKLDTFNDYHHLAVAIIWIALGGYFKNNPLKAVASYYHGMKLLTKQLRKMGRVLQDGTISHDVSEPITACIITKNPGKWVLQDLETGVKYRPIGGDITHQWEKI